MKSDFFMNIAHRGASGYYPENTLIAFKKAVEMGAEWLECDVRLTSDNKVVVIHDKRVDRTTDGRGLVSDYTLKELKKLEPEIPALSELLEMLKDTSIKLVVEIKDGINYPEIIEKVMNLIQEYHLVDQVTISAFHLQVLNKVKKIEPDIKTAFLAHCSSPDEEQDYIEVDGKQVKIYKKVEPLLKDAAAKKVDMLCPPAAYVNKERVKKMQEEGYPVRAWGLKKKPDRKEMRRLIKTGINGMTTNFPDILAEVYQKVN